jgi:hypothetical protein
VFWQVRDDDLGTRDDSAWALFGFVGADFRSFCLTAFVQEELEHRAASECAYSPIVNDGRRVLHGRDGRLVRAKPCVRDSTRGWPDHRLLQTVIAYGRRSASNEIKISSIAATVRLGKQQAADLNKLLTLANSNNLRRVQDQLASSNPAYPNTQACQPGTATDKIRAA